ncbi:MAG: UTP--glucose-1-phosphate uridylyltransferase, partial [Chloroflexi bacterium]|nr:UTP--glucose-1-phosphate uridylyltransferase [Chloroflexota bacterium]
MNVRTAVIPAAGYGTRFLPVSKAVPKEMLPLVDRPVIQYAVEQAVEAGIERVVLVTSAGKGATEEYFAIAPALEAALERRGHAKLDEVRRVSRMVELVPVTQAEPLGLGHAVLCARDAVGGEPFVVYLPDEIVLADPSVTRQLLDASERLGGSVAGVIEVARADVARYGVIAGEQVEERAWRLSGLVEKPPVEDAPSNLAVTGPYVLSPAIFDCLAAVEAGAVGEIQLTDGLDALAKREPVFAYRFEGKRFDAGTPLGLIETAVELALERPELASELGAWIKDLA